MIWALGALSSLGFVVILGLAIGAPKLGFGTFWPPQSDSTWQHRSFRILFRVGLYPLIALSALIGRDFGFSNTIIGSLLLVVGFGCAFLFTGKLGWKQAFGKAEGLVSDGIYAHSRNPVYVATWVGLLGWGILLPYAAVILPLVLWGLLYLIAPFLEEPWLEQKFGQAYVDYSRKTPRFLIF